MYPGMSRVHGPGIAALVAEQEDRARDAVATDEERLYR